MTEPPAPNPLVVAPEHEDAQPPGWEGAGVASSWADLNAALGADQVDPAQVVFTAAGAGLDTLGAIASPLDTFASAGVGWLIEHVWFLHEPLDALAGDPTQITAHAQTWHNVASELAHTGAEYRRSASALVGWDGAASVSYRATVDRYGTTLEHSAKNAAQLADLVLTTGAHVGTIRALIRDAIADFVSAALQYIAASLMLAGVTAGGTVGAATLHIVVGAIELGESIARRVSDLLDTLAAAGGSAQQLSDAIRQTAAQVDAAAPQVQATAGTVEERADELGAGRLIEAGKQETAAEQDQRGWGGDAG